MHFPISCSSEAQLEFKRAVALLHHMTYPQAREAFERVADDRSALRDGALGHRDDPVPAALADAAAPRRSSEDGTKCRKRKASSHRRSANGCSSHAAEAFFLEPGIDRLLAPHPPLGTGDGKALPRLSRRPEAAAFYALAHLATAPSDIDFAENARRSRRRILLRIYKQNPDHPGAMHYLVHANDVPGREHEELEITRKYENVAPNNPHALHMPTHIYTRLGDWDGVIRGNLRAAEAALRYPAGEHGEFVWDEFPHAIEYLVYAYLQKGDTTTRGRSRTPAGHSKPGAELQDRISPRRRRRPATRSNVMPGRAAAIPARAGRPRLGRFPGPKP